MILRGVSKFYAAPGMRLGYGITGNLEFLKKMKEKQVPWSLNSLGALAGELMLKDKNYIRQTRDLILSERTRLLKALENIPTYKTYPAYANFLLLKIQKARPDLQGRLRRLHPPGSHDPRLLLFRMPGRRIHPLLPYLWGYSHRAHTGDYFFRKEADP